MKLTANRTTSVRLAIACSALFAAVAFAPRASAADVTKNFTVSGRANVRIDTRLVPARRITGNNAGCWQAIVVNQE